MNCCPDGQEPELQRGTILFELNCGGEEKLIWELSSIEAICVSMFRT